MNPSTPDDPRRSPAETAGKTPTNLTAAFSVLRLLGQASDTDQLERMILVLAAHPEGGGFDRVRLMLWDPRTERLHERRHLSSRPPASSLPLDLESVRRVDPEGMRVRSERLSSPRGVSPILLEGAAATSWERGESAIGIGPADGVMVGAFPVRGGDGLLGLVVGEWLGPGEAGDRQGVLSGLEAVSNWAVGALERSRKANRLAQHSAALSEMARATVSPGNLAEILHLIARLAATATESRGSALWLIAPSGEPDVGKPGSVNLRLEVTFGPTVQRERLGRALQPLAAEVVAAGKPRVVEHASEEFLLSPESAAALTAFAIVPLTAYGRTLGALAVYDRERSHPAESPAHEPDAVQFLTSLADHSALAIDRASGFLERDRLERRIQELGARLRKQERLSSLGESASRTAQEARNPLASIRTFARRVSQALAEDDPRRDYLEIVKREADRLESILESPLDYAGPEPPALRMGSLNDVVQEVLQRAGETLVRRRIRLLKKLSPELPPLLLDIERVRHATARILDSALESVAIGGRIRIETRRVAKHVVLEVGHDGPRAPGEALEQLFLPFGTSRTGGSAIGLGVAQRIVREHGGEIRVRAEGEWSTIIAFTIPIHENEDRRRGLAERRSGVLDRRARFPQT